MNTRRTRGDTYDYTASLGKHRPHDRWSGFPLRFIATPNICDEYVLYPGAYLIGTALFLLLLGLPGSYPGQKTRMKNMELISVSIASIGTVLQVGYVLVDGFLSPAAAASAPSSVVSTTDVHVLFLRSIGPLALLILVSEFLFVGGYLLFGVQIVHTHTFPQWAGLLLLSGAVLFGTQILLPMFVADPGAALFGLAFLEIGYAFLSKSKERGQNERES